jgi:hypothetical protein
MRGGRKLIEFELS